MSEPFAIHPNLKQLSNSSCVTLHKCKRRFELDKLLPQTREHDYHTLFGTVVGIGVQTRIVTGSMQRANIDAFRAWEWDIEESNDKMQRDKKTLWHALIAIDNFEQLMQQQLSRFEIACFDDGRPAVELGFSIDCGDGFFYRGFIDAVMICRATKQIIVIECKTTKFSELHEAMYKNSGQALGYSLIIDALIARLGLDATSSYKVYYPVYKTGKMEWQLMPFIKTNRKRAMWIKDILLDIQTIRERAMDNYFPMYGESCYDFFKVCPHFERCEFPNSVVFGGTPPEVRVEAADKYDFHFSLVEIIDAQLAIAEAGEQ